MPSRPGFPWRGVPTALLLTLVLRAVGNGADYPACRNPLFSSIWPGVPAGRPRLDVLPDLGRHLQRCVQYRDRASCCNPDVEANALEPAFEAWRRWLGATLAAIRSAEQRLGEMQRARPEVYDQAAHEDFASLRDMLQRLGSLLEATPRCFDTVLEYAAGMLCLSCRPDWQHLGVVETGAVDGQPPFRVRIPEYESSAVWAQCEDFSARGLETLQAMAKAQYWMEAVGGTCFDRLKERLDLFASPESLRQGLYEIIALHPMYGGQQSIHQGSVAVQIPPPLPMLAVPSTGSLGVGSFGAVSEGQQSGFDTLWPRDPAEAARLTEVDGEEGSEFEDGLLRTAEVPGVPSQDVTKSLWPMLPWALVVLIAPFVTIVYGGCDALRLGTSRRTKVVRESTTTSGESQGLLTADDSD